MNTSETEVAEFNKKKEYMCEKVVIIHKPR
jgi:hypothetical protein